MIKWTPTTEEKYWEMLEVLPPAIMTDLGFLVGEPLDHGACPITGNFGPRFEAFAKVGDDFFVAAEAMSPNGFRQITPQQVTTT